MNSFESKRKIREDRDYFCRAWEVSSKRNAEYENLLYFKNQLQTLIVKITEERGCKIVYMCDNSNFIQGDSLCLIVRKEHTHIELRDLTDLYFTKLASSDKNRYEAFSDKDFYLKDGTLDFVYYTFDDIRKGRLKRQTNLSCKVSRTKFYDGNSDKPAELLMSKIYIYDLILSDQNKGIGSKMLDCLKEYVLQENIESKYGRIKMITGSLSSVDYKSLGTEEHKRLVHFYSKNGFKVNGTSLRFDVE